MGTGIAAAVAQTAHNAQREARVQDSRARESRDAERASYQAFQMHLSSAAATHDADQELPDKPPPSYQKLWEGGAEAQPSAPAGSPEPDPAQLHLYDPTHPAQPTPLYRHLDVQA